MARLGVSGRKDFWKDVLFGDSTVHGKNKKTPPGYEVEAAHCQGSSLDVKVPFKKGSLLPSK